MSSIPSRKYTKITVIFDIEKISSISPEQYQENSHPENSHLENSQQSRLPLVNYLPENFHLENSHLEYFHPWF